MQKIIISRLCALLNRYNDSLSKNDLLKIEYVLQVILGDVIKFLILLIIFVLLDRLFIFILSYIIFISLRPFLGGIHCKTYISCLMLTIAHFSAVVMLCDRHIEISSSFYIIFYISSFLITLIYAPCINVKRPVKNKTILKVLSLISLNFWSILYFVINISDIRICIFLNVLLQMIQLIIINIKETLKCKNQ